MVERGRMRKRRVPRSYEFVLLSVAAEAATAFEAAVPTEAPVLRRFATLQLLQHTAQHTRASQWRNRAGEQSGAGPQA